jgi:hypothetical protein
MTDLTNVQCNHKFLTTLSLTIHIQNISFRLWICLYQLAACSYQPPKVNKDMLNDPCLNNFQKKSNCGTIM